MGRLSGSGGRNLPPFISPSSSFTSSSYSKRSRAVRRLPSLPKPPLAPPAPHFVGRGRRKKAPTRLWMRMDRWGRCEVFMCDNAFIAERSGVYARDVRVIGPLLSRCTSIFAREKAMVICLEFVRAIVTADEVLLLEPLAQEVIPFVDRLRQHFPLKSVEDDVGATRVDDLDRNKHAKTDSECELPFEFKVLELALEAVCLSFHSSLSDLNRHVVFVLDDLTKNVSSRNLERVRSLKSNLTSLLAGVHKIRDEVEHLLDHNENMAQLHLSRKQVKSLQDESVLVSTALNSNFSSHKNLARPNSVNQAMGITSIAPLDSDAGDLEMLLESYFMQLDGIRNRITMVRGYIVDTEDYINIQLDNQRNKLIQLHLTLIIVSFGIAINTWIVASFGMNLPHNGVRNTSVGLFWPFVGATSSFCLLVIILLFGYAWRNRLLCS